MRAQLITSVTAISVQLTRWRTSGVVFRFKAVIVLERDRKNSHRAAARADPPYDALAR
jgi:hypothetical protein